MNTRVARRVMHVAASPRSTRLLARWLQLAAAPVFAAMALVTHWNVDADGLFCGAGPSALCSMTTMYALMAVMHLPAWLRAQRPRATH